MCCVCFGSLLPCLMLHAHTLFRRTGDINPAHSPASPLTTATAPAADHRGRLLLTMLNSIEFCYHKRPLSSSFPQQQTLHLFPKTKHVFYSRLQSDSQTSRTPHSHMSRSSKGPPWIIYKPYASLNTLHLTPPLHSSTSHLPCPLYHSKRFKDKQTTDAYTSHLHLLTKLPKSNPPSVDQSYNLRTPKYLRNRSLTLQMPQSPKSFNTRHK